MKADGRHFAHAAWHGQWALAAALVAALLTAAAAARAEGLWDGENLLADRKVVEHDLVTVVAPAEPADDAAGSGKNAKTDGKPAVWPAPSTAPSLHDRVVRRLGRRFTARVIEALPHGNLAIESQTVTVRDDTITETVFIGEVRARDVAEDRTAPLSRVGQILLSVTTRRMKEKEKEPGTGASTTRPRGPDKAAAGGADKPQKKTAEAAAGAAPATKADAAALGPRGIAEKETKESADE